MPKSSSARRTPSDLSLANISSVESPSARNTPSVISSSSRSARTPVSLQGVGDHRDDARVVELQRRQVDRDADMVGPLRRFLERRPQHPFADLPIRPASSASGMNLAGEIGPRVGWLPADQRFEARDLLACGVDDRLVVNRELAALDRLAEVVFEDLALGRLAVHRRLVEAMLAAARRLGRIEREVGVADQRVGAGAAGVADGDADRGADRDLVAFDRIGPRDLLDQRPGERLQKADVDRAGKHRLEFVAAEAADLAVVAHHRLQPLGDLPEQGVADRMAERVVDVLEAVEIDQEQRAALLPMGRVAQRLVERLAHHRAVGQAGQRIEPGEPVDLLLGAALLGEVGADAAEAEEAAAIVEDRVARQRPVDVLLARRPDDDVGEGEAGGQVEAERLALLDDSASIGVDRQQIGELAAEQLLGLALEVVGELLRNVGQSAERIGFPEPAAAAVLELVDEMLRLARLRLELEALAPGRDDLRVPAML